MKIARNIAKLEAMSRGQRQNDIVLSGCRLKFEVELATEALTQRQAPGPIDAAAVGRMDHELHSAGFIEEALEDEGILLRQATQRAIRGSQILDQLLGRRAGKSKILHQPPQRAFALRIEVEALLNLCPQARDGTGKLVASPWCLAEPERYGGWGTASVFHADDASFDT